MLEEDCIGYRKILQKDKKSEKIFQLVSLS